MNDQSDNGPAKSERETSLPPSTGSKSGLEPGKVAWVTWQDGPQVCIFREQREDPQWDHCIITHQLNGEWFTRGVDSQFVFPDLRSAKDAWNASMRQLREDLNAMEL
jgi:hypothetical protein